MGQNLKKETIKKLKELKNNLNYDIEENYCDMVNILIDYDNKAQDSLYLYDNFYQNFEPVDDEMLEYYVKYQIETFGIDRYFYMFNEVDEVNGIYRTDAYGNLHNFKKNDLENAIDEAIETLER